MDVQAIHSALTAIWEVVADANRYFASQEPWALKKTDPDRMNTVLYVTAECVRQLAILAQPFLPSSAARMLDILAAPSDARDFNSLGEAGRLTPGTDLPAPSPVFPRYVEAEAD
jgi:methionyl-tRNA synthetase